jgi:hypothetical protein
MKLLKLIFIKRIYLIILLLLINCSPEKKLQRIIKKHPELLEVYHDTIKLRDTIYIESYVHDTINQIKLHDTTIIVNNNRTFARYYYDTLRETIFHEIKCKGDTVYYYKEIPFKVEKVVFKELSWWDKYKTIIYIILSVLIALFLLNKFKEFIPFL